MRGGERRGGGGGGEERGHISTAKKKVNLHRVLGH